MENRSAADGNFGFGFNDMAFSDRVLRLEIVAANIGSGGEKCLDWFSSLDPDDLEESGTDFQVKKLHINSLVLASKSPFFYKLFKNGMKESEQRNDVTVRINASEEAALMDLLSFMYGNPPSATSACDLVDVLMAADKFEVMSCVQCCTDLLMRLPMSVEYALFCLVLPPSVLAAEAVKPLIDAAKMHLVSYFRDFNEARQEEAMALPLSALGVVLGSDGLKVQSEEDVFDFILKWARANYPKLEVRQEILTNLLVNYICFQYLSSLKLKEVVECPDQADLDYKLVSTLVLKALISKDQALPTSKCGFPIRIYEYRIVKVVQLEFVRRRCVVYLDLKKEDCEDLFQTKELTSQDFCLGGRDLYLCAQCDKEESTSVDYFTLYVEMTGSESCDLDIEFAVMKKPSNEFQTKFRTRKCAFTETESVRGCRLFEWTDLMSDKSVYFINGILRLRAQITISN